LAAGNKPIAREASRRLHQTDDLLLQTLHRNADTPAAD